MEIELSTVRAPLMRNVVSRTLMRITTVFVPLLFILLLGCNKSQESKVYFWRAVYNPQNYDGNYQIKTEIDTVLKSDLVDLEAEEYRKQLYVDEKRISHLIDSLRSDNAFVDTTNVTLDYPLFTKLPVDVSLTHFKGVSDSLFVISTQLTTHYYHTKYGLIKVTFPHSGQPGKIFSYELKRLVSKKNGKTDTLEIDPIIKSIRKENLEALNKKLKEEGENIEIKEWY